MRVLTDDELYVLTECGRLQGAGGQHLEMTSSARHAAPGLMRRGYLIMIPFAPGLLRGQTTTKGKLAVRCHEAFLKSQSGQGMGGG